MRFLLLPSCALAATAALAQPSTPNTADLAFAMHVCTDTAVQAAPGSIGAVTDLDATNRGCLIGGERQGVWMHFRMATAGRVGFTIAPAEPSSDYDFAVWGPYDTPVTELNELPARCNFSGVAGNGGLDYVATQLSAGPGGTPWLRYLDVEAGEWYMLYVDNFALSGLEFDLTWQLQGGATLGCLLPPVSAMMASTTTIEPGSTVDFTDMSTGYPYLWSWSFPDAEPNESFEQNPTGILYALPGCYDVFLTVESAAGESSVEEFCFIVVEQNTGIHDAAAGAFDFKVMAGMVSLVNSDGTAFRYAVRDAQGRTVASGSATRSVQFGIEMLSQGAYTIEASANGAMPKVWRFVR